MWFEKNFYTYTVLQKLVKKADNFNNSELKMFLISISGWGYLRSRPTVRRQKKLSPVYVKSEFQSKNRSNMFYTSKSGLRGVSAWQFPGTPFNS